MGRLDDRLSRLQDHLRGGVPPELGDVSENMHPRMRQKLIDESRGFANYCQPPDLTSLVDSNPELAEGVRYVMRFDWTTAGLVQCDYELLSGEEEAVDLARFIIEQEGIESEESMEEMLAAAQARLDALADLEPQQWRTLYESEEDDRGFYDPTDDWRNYR